MRTMFGVLLAAVVAAGARAEQITFPLSVDYPILQAALAAQFHADTGGRAVLWGSEGGCRELTLRDVDVEPAPPQVRFVARGHARLGFRFLGFCFAPLSWDGYVETLATPVIAPDWRLRFTALDSHVYDAEKRRTFMATRLWDVVQDRVHDQLGELAIDLAPPVAEARALIRASVDPARAAPVLQALETFRPAGVDVDDHAIHVRVAVDVPAAEPSGSGPEPALAPVELERWQATLESWDAFLVFVIKDIGALDADQTVRDDLLELLLSSRQRLLAALAGGPQAGVDPVRQLFLDAWERLHRIVRDAALRGTLRDRALRYATFLAAGDALAAFDSAGPALGIEISADGLRRLARVLEPDFVGDPVAYSEAPDPTLRELFRFHDPAVTLPEEPTPAPDEGTRWWWIGPRAAFAASEPADELATVTRRLDRWVPASSDLGVYRDAVGRLLGIVARRTAAVNAVDARFSALYDHVVSATAWQESCWRQFVEQGGRTTYLLSKSGDVGLMQVNRRVWRGLFDVTRLEWDIAYNAGAGAEILAQLLARYGAREGIARLENAARATYAAYNGGPDAYRRYRLAKVPRAQRAIDRAFWEKFQAVVAGRALDFVLCIESWGTTSTARLSTAPSGVTPKCCMSARSSPATATISSRHASIASRPRASFV
jgi:hypothetical protein